MSTPAPGTCPKCHADIELEDNALPEHCPRCRQQLRLQRTDFIPCVLSALRPYVSIRGRATRAEFWWFVLFSLIFSYVVAALGQIAFSVACAFFPQEQALIRSLQDAAPNTLSPELLRQAWESISPAFLYTFIAINALVSLLQWALMPPSFCLMVRRLHDTGRSAFSAVVVFTLSTLITAICIYFFSILIFRAIPLALEGAGQVSLAEELMKSSLGYLMTGLGGCMLLLIPFGL